MYFAYFQCCTFFPRFSGAALWASYDMQYYAYVMLAAVIWHICQARLTSCWCCCQQQHFNKHKYIMLDWKVPCKWFRCIPLKEKLIKNMFYLFLYLNYSATARVAFTHKHWSYPISFKSYRAADNVRYLPWHIFEWSAEFAQLQAAHVAWS